MTTKNSNINTLKISGKNLLSCHLFPFQGGQYESFTNFGTLERNAAFGCMLNFSTLQEASAEDLSMFSFGGEWINNWSDCTCSTLGTLYYRDDAINQLDSVLYSGGLTRHFKLSQTNVKASHAIEDTTFGGRDYQYADGATLYAFAGHGGIVTTPSTATPPNTKTFRATYCSLGPGTYTPITDTGESACRAESLQMRFGEEYGTTFGANSGYTRWLIYSTCHTIEDTIQWKPAFSFGLDILMGYYGLSTDCEMTDENMADFAEDAVVDTNTFKQTWFDANEDWYVDDYAAILTCEGTNLTSTAPQILNNYRRTWTKRLNNGSNQICAYATHLG